MQYATTVHPKADDAKATAAAFRACDSPTIRGLGPSIPTGRSMQLELHDVNAINVCG